MSIVVSGFFGFVLINLDLNVRFLLIGRIKFRLSAWHDANSGLPRIRKP
jgi:hypothetical protein